MRVPLRIKWLWVRVSLQALNIMNEEKASVNEKECSNAFKSVQNYRLQNPMNVIIRHLNIDSLRNKIVAVEELMQSKVDICLFSETKLDETFPN